MTLIWRARQAPRLQIALAGAVCVAMLVGVGLANTQVGSPVFVIGAVLAVASVLAARSPGGAVLGLALALAAFVLLAALLAVAAWAYSEATTDESPQGTVTPQSR